MKFLTYRKGSELTAGVRTEQGIVDLESAAVAVGAELPPDGIHGIILAGQDGVQLAGGLVDRVLSDETLLASCLLEESSLELGPSVPLPSKIICVGLNYRKHAEETKAEIPTVPILFSKFHNAITAHGQTVEIPAVTNSLDYEAELAIVIGKRAKNVSQEDALSYVFGYTCANDLSARDLQRRTSQWLLGKSCDGFAPVGPYLVTADEVGNPNALHVSCSVNGERRQSSSTGDMIFPCDELISYISRHMTLEPGDLILTGTPEGVVVGRPKEERVFLQDGDVVTVEIEKLGALTVTMKG